MSSCSEDRSWDRDHSDIEKPRYGIGGRPSGQRKFRAEKRAPGAQRLTVLTAAHMIDGESGLAPGRTQKIACPRFARRIHSVADCRTETGGVRPLVEDPVGKRGEEA